MFGPDLFSVRKPAFVEAPPESSGAVRSLLASHYPELGKVTGRIFQSGSIEVNSNNFLFETSSGRYIAKRWPPGAGQAENDERLRQARLANWLAEQKLPVPEVLMSSTGQLIVAQAGRCWCVMNYIDGEYFTGEDNELLEAGQGIRRLFLALEAAPGLLQAGPSIPPPGPDALELMRRVEEGRDHWEETFGEINSALLVRAWAEIRDALSKILSLVEASVDEPASCHIDLHPHNLLMRDGRLLAILDSGSLVRAARTTMISFNLFKLARQAVVARKGNFREAGFKSQVERSVAELIEGGLLDNGDPEFLALSAKVEIMRRLLLILSLAYEQDNRDWNHVLPIQIRALSEADAVFS